MGPGEGVERFMAGASDSKQSSRSKLFELCEHHRTSECAKLWEPRELGKFCEFVGFRDTGEIRELSLLGFG